MKLFNKHSWGFRIWRFEFYKVTGKRELYLDKGSCGCIIVDLYFFGVTWLAGDCYKYADDNEPNV